MISRDILPSQELASYISRYRLRHFIFDNDFSPSFKPFPPRPEQCLIFYPRGKEMIEYTSDGKKVSRSRSVISGQFTERVNRYIISREFLMIEVDLKPGALHSLTGVPFHEFCDKCVDAESVLTKEIRLVNERLSSADNYDEMIRIIELFLLYLVSGSLKTIPALDQLFRDIITQSSSLTLDQMAIKTFLSPRQLERKFIEKLGVGPKTFFRISRFNLSYWMRFNNPEMDWFTIAIHCGYSDYQHLSKEYKTFASATPNVFLSEESNAPGRILGLTK